MAPNVYKEYICYICVCIYISRVHIISFYILLILLFTLTVLITLKCFQSTLKLPHCMNCAIYRLTATVTTTTTTTIRPFSHQTLWLVLAGEDQVLPITRAATISQFYWWVDRAVRKDSHTEIKKEFRLESGFQIFLFVTLQAIQTVKQCARV